MGDLLKIINLCKVLATAMILFLNISHAWCTTVNVYAEGGCEETKFIMYIYADVGPSVQGPLISAGVKLHYPALKLVNPIARKNERDWYLGTPESPYSYFEPKIDTPGEVLLLLGKFDEGNPQMGVEGQRILLGTVLFDRIDNTDTPIQQDFTLSEGKSVPFVDFATVEGHDLDNSVSFSILPVVTGNTLSMKRVIRILQLITGMDTDVPVRVSEMDTDSDGVVGLSDAISLMKAMTQ